MLKIAIYGKGGIGKSTTASNLSAALSDLGYRVMQIGCDPKSDSTKNLMSGQKIPTVLDQIREKGVDNVRLEDIVFTGYGGILCVEAGGPTPGIGCAGRGIITAFEKLEDLGAYEQYRPDIVLYDVLGDVVCGGFAMPIRGNYADHVFIVTSGEMMALYAASNIASAIHNFGKRGYARFSGIILNKRNIDNEEALVQKAAEEMDGQVISVIPRDCAVQKAEELGMTVLEALPESDMAQCYRRLATKFLEVCGHDVLQLSESI
ncbi:MAG: nitrogenase iron protein NifH [Clostridiales bacterium]|nr:nitrogenase iron protein NifH [Clostridiales bacterium]